MSATVSESASARRSSSAPSASSAPSGVVEDLVAADFAFPAEASLGEGKTLALPDFVKADKQHLESHRKALQSEFESVVKDGCVEDGARVNVSWAPATYVFCKRKLPHDPHADPHADPRDAHEWRLVSVEGELVGSELLGSDDHDGALDGPLHLDLLSGPRGMLIDMFGDGTVTYVLRGEGAHTVSCRARSWKDPGAIDAQADVPDLPLRGVDLDGDRKLEFPERVFSYSFTSLGEGLRPIVQGACNVDVDRLTIDVMGPVHWSGGKWDTSAPTFRTFYEHKLEAARARVQRQRASFALPPLDFGADAGASEAHPKSTRRFKSVRDDKRLVFDDDCAIDVAQAAAELFVYAHVLGASATEAIAGADRAMSGFALIPEACGASMAPRPTATTGDRWPAMRSALLRFEPPKVLADAPVDPAPSGAPSVAVPVAASASAH